MHNVVWIEPVRDWNIIFYVNFLTQKSVWIEPVRDWNVINFSAFPAPHFVWIEPVRDWNFEAPTTISVFTISVNWTCEGLKQLKPSTKPKIKPKCELNLWGIETFFASKCR